MPLETSDAGPGATKNSLAVGFRLYAVQGVRWRLPCRLGITRTFQNIRLFGGMTAMESVMVGRHVRTKHGLIGAVFQTPAERKEERETKDKGYVRRERSFGRIERIVPLPAGLDPNAATAKFKNGVLTVTIAKTAEARDAVKR